LGLFCLPLLSIGSTASATSLQVHGQAGLVGDYFNSIPPEAGIYQGWRLPLGLTLEARPATNFGLFLDLRMGQNRYPELARSMGNPQGSQAKGAQPFATKGGRGERDETPQIGFGYLEYMAQDLGAFKVGRMPRHWGLGLWRDDAGVSPTFHSREWLAEGGTVSTTDGLAFTLDFRGGLVFNAYWEKFFEGDAFSRGDDAEAWTAELTVGDSQVETGVSGFSREVGIAFSRYTDGISSARMNVLDIYAKLRYGALLVEGEVLYPNGSTKSAEYADLGGATGCVSKQSLYAKNLMCERETIDAVSALFRTRYLISSSGGSEATLGANETLARRGIPTLRRRETHAAGLWFGYTSGDADAFVPGEKGNKITMGVMHPNVRPSLLMFNSIQMPIAGMPGASVQNSIFARAEYTYENPAAGSFTPAIIWGELNTTRPAGSGLSLAETEGYGRYADLGYEFNLGYSYMTTEFIKVGFDAGFWLPGAAWSKTGTETPTSALGGRLSLSTVFH
jgi:hypothetical protein